jgi:hypothetical protein
MLQFYRSDASEARRAPKPVVVQNILVRKTLEGPAVGDNSNSQYAALGLRACHDAGIVFPKEVIERARKWWFDSQWEDEGWGYVAKGEGSDSAYGSMTAGAVGSVAIYDYILDEKQSWKRDPVIHKGLDWLAKNFSVTENPRCNPGYKYYYLYALERAAVLYGTDRIGPNDWYSLGTKEILEKQRPDGSWHEQGSETPIWDTCFAILFLRRATRPLVDVASVDSSRKRQSR